MMMLSEESTAHMMEKFRPEEETMSTTEESNSSANGDISTSEDDKEETDVELRKQEALRQYGKRFGFGCSESGVEVDTKQASLVKSQTDLNKVPQFLAGTKPVDELLAEVDLDMALEEDQKAGVDLLAGANKSASELLPTFGYAGSLDERPPFAKFDVRDHICLKVGGFKHGEVVKDRSGGEMVVVGVKKVEGMPRLWFHPKDLGRPGAGAFHATSLESLKMRVSPTSAEQSAPHFHEMTADEFDAAEDLDGEDVVLCSHCKMPVGEIAYTYNNVLVHGECMAQMMLNDYKKEEDGKNEEADKLKKEGRKRYDIGWQTQEVPHPVVPEELLNCQPAPEGMCCLVFDEEAHSVSVAPTLEPAESLNLEYLSLALQVRMLEGREPLFSLDPVAGTQREKHTMQAKRFEPEWLAGTSVGEVMFQADYHLKELSMGEFMQPIVGMKNLLDFAQDEGLGQEWNAREWFVVRKAEVLLTDEKVLVPRVKMAIEAREQEVEDNELVDKTITRPNHPMVKYADAFTHNFDLIAERKSVMFHLRELARASAMAKMLIDGEVNLDNSWFTLSGEVKDICAMEVPQLWNHRGVLKMRVRDGEVLDEEGIGGLHRCQGIYGGVNFGLEMSGVSMPNLVATGRLARLGVGAGIASTRLSAMGFEAKAGISMPVVSRGLPVTAAAAVPSTPAKGVSAPQKARPAVAITAAVTPTAAPAPVSRAPVSARPTLSAAPVLGSRPSEGLKTVAAPAVTRELAAPIVSRELTVAPLGSAPGATVTRAPSTPAMSMAVRELATPAAAISAAVAPATVSRAAMPARPAISVALPGLAAVQPGLAAVRPAVTPGVAAHLSKTVLSRTAPVSTVDPRGVDLNLDQFNLATPMRMEGGGWGSETSDVKSVAMGSAFWASIDEAGSEFRSDDKKLLQAIYDPNLCDRRQEGEYFVPPDTSFDYVEKLRVLVHEEEECREQRIEKFLSPDFSTTKPGPLFPKTWAPSVEISRGKVDAPAAGALHARPHYLKQAQKLIPVLKTTTPSFDKSTEEGMRFRVYRLGSLEVRTTQVPTEQEVIGAVFATGAAGEQGSCADGKKSLNLATIVKVTEYIEEAVHSYGSYVVLELEDGDMIVTEKLPTGITTWQENPADLESRNALAKVVRTSECGKHGLTAQVIQEFQAEEYDFHIAPDCCSPQNKYYAQGVYNRAIKADNNAYTGYRKPEHSKKWQLSERKYGLYATSAAMSDTNEIAEAEMQNESKGKRPSVGDKVQLKTSGRQGTITADDGSAVPYQVIFADGQRPKTKWVKVQDVEAI